MLKATNGTDTVYYTRGFELISRREGDAASYYLYDGGLSVRALTDEAGAVTDTLVFDAFGNETEKTGTTANTYGFQGEEQDATGLYYLRARYMDPASGTFTSMDTYAGSLSDPMSLHKYLFANSNPVMYSDPSGHLSSSEQLLVCALIGEIASSVLYFTEYISTDNIQYSNLGEAIGGALSAAFTGIIAGILFCLLYVVFAWITTEYIATVIFGVAGFSLSGYGVLEGLRDIDNGSITLGKVKIVINAIFAVLSLFSLVNGAVVEYSSNNSNNNVSNNSSYNNSSSKQGNTTNQPTANKNNNSNNRFPNNPDDFMREIPREKIVNSNGTQRQTIYASDYIKIRAEQHPLKTGEVYNPRHHGVHYHVEIRNNSSLSWNNANNVHKVYPNNYTPGSGSGFLPGELYPGK